MELNHDVIDTPPRDAASVVMLRDGAPGLQVLLLRRHTDSAVLGGAYVFPGGKVDAADSSADMLARLDRAPSELQPRLGEPGLSPEQAAAFYVAAAREAAEESGVLFLQVGAEETATRSADTCARLRAGEPFAALLAEAQARLDTDALAPWSRWITPRRPSVMNKRFDTRFFLAAVPPLQEARHDDFEVTEARWLTPRAALRQYQAHEIDLAPPQIVGLLHLLQYRDVAHAMQDARSRPPPLIVPEPVETGDTRVLCYPGDEHHPVPTRALPEPVPTRVVWRNKRFEPPQGFNAFLD
ncbi:NUDIX hydrolase [Ottowia sp.]|uniref:NUDIX hydrolase n=1 Tax=Ottowia sp. TaxID=1898956 RepID=UPI002CAA01B4|nr:NUDIX hydrolase [Ottowia sp.]HOB65973.1 NUDIX domain-containing protein [Ottowia sp.]HPZ58167.1 NUDIX domain-containing protein [Ottowia sp.]HQD49168.1 NUDIX domain-containing protein [Ottowia sp.]